MNIYEDYSRYLSDNKTFLEQLKNNAPSVYVLLEDVIEVLNFISHEKSHNQTIEEDLLDFFEPGFRYITSLISEMTIMLNDYFQKDIFLFSKYSELIVYFFFIDDLKGHLYANDLLNEENLKVINNMQEEIEQIMVKHLEIDANRILEYEAIIDELAKERNYHPVYTIFAMVREELHLI